MYKEDYQFGVDKIAFIHIPKTGGTTVRYMIKECPDILNKTINVAQGVHRPISKLRPPEEYKYFTFLREPISRCWSYWQMVKRDPSNPWNKYINDFDEFLNNCWEVNNLACQQIAGCIRHNVNQEIYQQSKNNLDNFFFVGLFEDFDVSVKKLLYLISGNNQDGITIPIKNRWPKNVMTEEQKQKIKERNFFDILLYNNFIKERKY